MVSWWLASLSVENPVLLLLYKSLLDSSKTIQTSRLRIASILILRVSSRNNFTEGSIWIQENGLMEY